MDITDYLRDKEKRLEKGSRLIKDFHVFDFNYLPEKPLMREEIRPVADALLRYMKTGVPNHVLIIGSRGAGKTLLVKSLVNHLQRRPDSPRFLYVNCRHHNTSFKILAEILGARPRGYALDELWREFESRFPKGLVFILDEVDLISEKDRNKDILYLLSRSERSDMTLLLSNNPRFHALLDPSIKSALQPEMVHFREYTADQVYKILEQRARLGLRKSDGEVLRHITGLTVRNTNADIRVGIKTLYLCSVEPEAGVEQNFQRARRDIAADIVNDLNDKNLLILKAAHQDREKYVKSVYTLYRRLSEALHESPFSYVHFYSNLSYLQSLGLILLLSTKVRRSYTNRIQILFDPEILESACKTRFGCVD
jgi:Cdc6-like AAA superfamily ATPase